MKLALKRTSEPEKRTDFRNTDDNKVTDSNKNNGDRTSYNLQNMYYVPGNIQTTYFIYLF